MNFYQRLIISLAVVAGIAAGLLAFTYRTTAPIIAQRALDDQVAALRNVFFLQTQDGKLDLDSKTIAPGVTALYRPDQPNVPAYYAAIGEGIGYNASVPISMVVGFTGPAADADSLLKGYVEPDHLPKAGQKGLYVVGFSVTNSEETPGLGEKIKDSRPPYTWVQAITGTKPAPDPDHATDFQRQFRGRLADSLVLKKNGGDLDAITASTFTSNGVIAALRDASEKVTQAIAANSK